VPSAVAAPLLCGGLTAISALKKARTQPGDWVVIAGAGGGVGHLACQIAARAYGLRVLAIDSAAKEAFVRACGAEEFLAVETYSPDVEHGSELVRAAISITGGQGATAAVVCTGVSTAFSRGLEILKFNGTLVVVGVQEGEELPISSASPNTFLFTQRSIVGSSVGNRKDAFDIMELAARGIVKPQFDLKPMEKLQETFQAMAAGKLLGKVVIEIP
jgi:propanol-preferring alcohol dehydrogenase